MVTRSYKQFCPMARSLDVVGNRWGLLVVRELMATGPMRFTDLQDRLDGVSSNLLAARLREMEDVGVIVRRELPPPAARTVYELTERGRDLEPTLLALGRWGMPFLDDPTDEEPLLPHLLPLGLKALLVPEAVPPGGGELVVAGDEGTFRVTATPDRDPAGRRVAFHRRVEVRFGTGEAPHVRTSLSTLAMIAHAFMTPSQAEHAGLLVVDDDSEPWRRAVLGLT